MSDFCPFINGECNDECIYRGNNIELHYDCDLYDDIKTLQSLQAPGNQIDKRLIDLESKLNIIDSNTSSDQTYSYEIKTKLDDIESMINKIVNK